MKIRAARHEDQGQLGTLLLASYGTAWEEEHQAASTAGCPTAPAGDELMAADDFFFSTLDLMNCCLFAVRDGEICGAACVNPYTAELPFLTVREAYRRQGIGRALLEAALGELRRRGVDHVKVDVPRHESLAGGEAFLEACGFTPVRRVTRLGLRLLESRPASAPDDFDEDAD